MKIILSFFCIFLSTISFAQNSEFFKGVDFDSSYCIVGIVQGHDDRVDSLSQYWFVLDDPADMIKLKKDWVFKNEVPQINIEFVPIEIYTLRNKMEIMPVSLIYPKQGIIKSENNWYEFDMREIKKLHKKHPLHYHTQVYHFDTFGQYVSFGNSLLLDSNLLFFFKPSIGFEGQFYIYANRSKDPDSPLWVLSDVNKVLKTFAADGTYESGHVLNDSFDLNHPEKTRISVHGPKSLYDKFESKDFQKGDWIPAIIEIKVFWRDQK
jgi:hypothetical protein